MYLGGRHCRRFCWQLVNQWAKRPREDASGKHGVVPDSLQRPEFRTIWVSDWPSKRKPWVCCSCTKSRCSTGRMHPGWTVERNNRVADVGCPHQVREVENCSAWQRWAGIFQGYGSQGSTTSHSTQVIWRCTVGEVCLLGGLSPSVFVWTNCINERVGIENREIYTKNIYTVFQFRFSQCSQSQVLRITKLQLRILEPLCD